MVLTSQSHTQGASTTRSASSKYARQLTSISGAALGSTFRLKHRWSKCDTCHSRLRVTRAWGRVPYSYAPYLTHTWAPVLLLVIQTGLDPQRRPPSLAPGRSSVLWRASPWLVTTSHAPGRGCQTSRPHMLMAGRKQLSVSGIADVVSWRQRTRPRFAAVRAQL